MPVHDPYGPHERFVSVARPNTHLRRVVVGLIAFEIGLFAFPWLLSVLGVGDPVLYALYLGAQPGWLTLSLLSFAVPVLCLRFVMVNMHQRGIMSLFGPMGLMLSQFRLVIGPLMGFMIMLQFLMAGDPSYIAETRPLASWAAMLPIAALAVLVQTGAEEVLYRGYLQQQIGALTRNPLWWMVLPSALFGISHIVNTVTVLDAYFYAIWAFAFGMMAADLTARSGTLGPAIAFHFSYNFVYFCTYGAQDGPVSGFALFLMPWDGQPFTYLDPAYPVWSAIFVMTSLLVPFILWLLARIALQR